MGEAKMCPLLTTVQVVQRGFAAQVIPVGEADVGGSAQSVLSQIQTSKAGGGFNPQLGTRKVVVYNATGGFDIRVNLPEGVDPKKIDPNDPRIRMTPETLVVPCQRGSCAFWCDKQQDCRLVAGSPAVALSAARSLLNKAHETMEGEEPLEETTA